MKARVLAANSHATVRGLETTDLIVLVSAALEVMARYGDPQHGEESFAVICQAANAFALLYGTDACQRFLRKTPAFITESITAAEKVLGLRRSGTRASRP